jgi:hypothetical protein
MTDHGWLPHEYQDEVNPTPEMIGRGVAMHRTLRHGPDETLVHDIWQEMYDEWMSRLES